MFNFYRDNNKVVKFICSMAICLAMFNCAGAGDKDDPCAATISPQLTCTIKYTVAVYYYTSSDTTRRRLPNCRMDIKTVKWLCEGTSKGEISLPNSYTNAEGLYSFTVGYNLHNSKDYIYATVDAYPGPPYIVVNPLETKSMNTITYNFASPGGTFERWIDLHILVQPL